MKSSCVITFEGLNLNRLFNTLCKRNIAILNIVRQGRKCEIEVPYTHSREVVALLEERCYNILGIRYVGIIALAQFVKKRFVLPIVALLCIVLIAVSSQFCFRIEIDGDYDNNTVLEALSDSGIRVGSNLSRVNVDNIENALSNNLDAMYAVVTRKGSVIYVNAVRRKEIDEPIDMTKRRDIVATHNGVVKSLLCEQGTAVVRVGDEVKVGDVLIEGRRIFNDGESRDVYALGRVQLELTAEGSSEYTGFKTVEQRTGNKFTAVGVTLFGKEYSRACKFLSYEVESQITYLNPLNVKINHNVYYETEKATFPATKEECLEELKQQAYAQAMTNCAFDVVDVIYTVTDRGVTARLIGSVEMR